MIESLSRRLQSAIAIGWFVLLWGAMIFGFGLFMARCAHAQEYRCSYVQRSYPAYDSWSGQIVTRYRYVRQCYRNHVYRYPERVYGYRQREDEGWERRDASSEHGINCKDGHVRVVGGLHLTKEGALNDAIRQWQSTVRYDAGEKFMDVENARGYRWRCDRAGTNETMAGKIGEALTNGQGFQRRCVVIAVPCMLPTTRGDRDEK